LSEARDPSLYRPNVGIMLLNADNMVFVAQRIDMPSKAWQMPQGGVDKGEDVTAAAYRELKEEIGTDNATIVATIEDWLYYDIPPELGQKLWKGKWKGQRQRWFAMRFLGDDSEINIETEDPEFSDWQWAELDVLPDLIVPFKRDLYAEVVRRFRPLVLS